MKSIVIVTDQFSSRHQFGADACAASGRAAGQTPVPGLDVSHAARGLAAADAAYGPNWRPQRHQHVHHAAAGASPRNQTAHQEHVRNARRHRRESPHHAATTLFLSLPAALARRPLQPSTGLFDVEGQE